MSAPEKERRYSTFEDLDVYQAARGFRKHMYRVARQLPDVEKFALANQIRRAGVSLTNNIVEGHGRYHYLEQMKFVRQARGSLQELIDDLHVCADEQYLPAEEIAPLKQESWRIRQLIDGYIRYLRSQKNSMGAASVREASPTEHNVEELDDDARVSI
ncbi:MAG: four helix bundle protein [Verrucomicrobia bacterium]|nr:MAG: four helix bundle protein [Verrucomicrobiota bacterium]